MTQLSDDCFAFADPLMPIPVMEQLIQDRVVPVADLEQVRLRDAFGRFVAHDLPAPLDLPPFDNSAVDGYALRHADLTAGETRLTVIDRIQAGHAATHDLAAGQAARIFTGAPMPNGADTVVMQEDVRLDGNVVVIPPGLSRGANRRPAGEDVAVGSILLPAGRRLGAADIALAAAEGVTTLPVRRRVRVALFSTGDEVIEPGAPRPPTAIYDANRHLLFALLTGLGAVVTDLGILPDDPDVLTEALRAAAADHDLVLTSGGVSAGEADHVRTAAERAGTLVFWRIAIKPGRPVAMGVLSGSNGNRAVFAGLPGNPAAVFVTFARVVRPLLRRLSGGSPRPLTVLPIESGFAYRKKAGRREYIRASLQRDRDGRLRVQKYPRDGAGVITSLTETDGLVELADEVMQVSVGMPVGFISYAEIVG